jgi:hypothetical protein
MMTTVWYLAARFVKRCKSSRRQGVQSMQLMSIGAQTRCVSRWHYIPDAQIIVVSNREALRPQPHRRRNSAANARKRPRLGYRASDAVMRRSWVSHGSGSADRDVVDAKDCIRVPPASTASVPQCWPQSACDSSRAQGIARQARARQVRRRPGAACR